VLQLELCIHHCLCLNPDLCCKLELVHPSHYILCWNPDLCYSLSCASITVCVGIQIFATNFSASSFCVGLQIFAATSVHHHLCWNWDCSNFSASSFCVAIQIWPTMEANLQCSRERSTYNMWTANWQKGIHKHNHNFMKLLLQNSAILWSSLVILFCNIAILWSSLVILFNPIENR
jgi:hypothetical protein